MAETGQPNALRWWALERGDIDATVAQVGFNVAQMIIPAFLLVPVGIAMGFSVGHLLAGLCPRIFRRLDGPHSAGRAACKARRPRQRHGPRVHQQRAGNYRLHAVDHAARVFANARSGTCLESRRRRRRVDRNHQARGGAAGGHDPPIHSQARHDDGVRRGHVHLSRHGPAAAHLRSAARGNRRAGHRRGGGPGQCSDHEVEDSAVSRGVARASRHWIVHRLHSSRLARFFRAAALRAHSGPAAGDGPRDSLSVRDRAHGDLPGAAGHRVGGRRELRRR